MIGRIITRLRRWFSRYPDDPAVEAVRAAVTQTPRAGGDAVIAVECVESPFFLGVLAAAAHAWRPRETWLLVTRSAIMNLIGRSWVYRWLHSLTFGRLEGERWARAYDVVATAIGYRGFNATDVVAGMGDWTASARICRELRSVRELEALTILGVPVGDLIIDSYLRFRPSPRVDLADSFLKAVVWQAHRDVRRARHFFATVKPQAYLTSYSTYVEHGVPVRVALQAGVRVFAYGNFTQIGKELTLDDWFHTPDASHYRSRFAALTGKAERLQLAEQQLRERLSGKIDPATSYMKVSAYASSNESLPDVRGAVVVFLHDFFDSPHIYHDLVFPDFWSWVEATIEALTAAGIPFYLKPHPNQVTLSSAVIDELKSRYPRVRFVPTAASNVQLRDAGMICGVTVYGTVAHELAFLGAPSIACARHPHHRFDFCRTARNPQEYAEFLGHAGTLPVAREELSRQALEFFYMHNLHGTTEELELRRAFVGGWKAAHTGPVDDLVRDIQRLGTLLDAAATQKSAGGAGALRRVANFEELT